MVPVESGTKTLKDALNEAMRDWVTNVENTFYIIGTVAGPHPYPTMVRDFQSVIGDECLEQMPGDRLRPAQPDAVVACVGGGSNAMGIFYPYIDHAATRLIGVEAAGEGLDSGKHAASLSAAAPACCTATAPTCCRTTNGQIIETHSITAGLDYPGVGPEHAYLKDIGRAEYVGITDDEALAAFHHLCRTEGIIPALESSHAVAYAMKLATTHAPRPAPARQPLRPRRQGHRHRRRARRAQADVRGMSRIAATFAALRRARPQGADPLRHRRRSVRRHHAASSCTRWSTAGADVIELGVPFSDPMADGPVIQKAGERALARGIGMTQVLAMVREFRGRRRETPVVLMGYANPVERYGVERFVADAQAAGVDGVLVVDYPPEECEDFAALLQGARHRPDLPARADLHRRAHRQVAEAASGYVYYVSLKGVTGAGHLDTDAVERR